MAEVFSDIDLSFERHPVSGDIIKKRNENSINQSIKNLILTNNFERPFDSGIGSGITGLLFNNANPMTSIMIQKTVEETINNYERRVELIQVSVVDNTSRNSSFDVTIVYVIVGTDTPITLQLPLRRTR